MNKQTLTYHTRLHDWYRQHCIQQEKHQPLQLHQKASPQPQSSTMIAQQYNHNHHKHNQGNAAAPGKAAKQGKANDAVKTGSLTTDKMYSIDEWCSEVNRTMFYIKKKEASPLFRKCRLSASTKSAMEPKTTDPRRVKSAEVFTRTGYWARQHKPILKGGELLPKQQGTSEKGVRVMPREDVGSAVESNYTKPEFCVRNSKENKTNHEETSAFPRVNHDSLNVRTSTVSQHNKHQSDKIVDKSAVLSSQFIPETLMSGTSKSPSDVGKGQRAKTVTVNYVVNNLVKENNERGSHGNQQNEAERTKNVKNLEDSRRNNRIFSASQRSVKTEINSSALGGDEESKAILNAAVRFCDQDAIPTFCNACSGIYSGNAPPPPTPATCANCVHGISVQGKLDHHHLALGQGPSHAEIQKELAQKLVRNEKVYGERVTSAKIELKLSETRLTEDSLHYSAEREMVRNTDAKPSFSLPNTFDDLGDERNMSFQDDDDDYSQGLSEGNFSGSNASMNSSPKYSSDSKETSMEKRGGDEKHVRTNVLIQTYSPVGDEENQSDTNDETQDWTLSQDATNLNIQRDRRGSRRLSLSYTYKPEVSNISKSNNLLRVLSIDDCKIGMRYNPHKVLEDHQVSDNPMAEMAKQAMGKFGSDLDNVEKDSQLAMRLSQNSSVTSLQTSSANDVTIANKLQYKILFGPEDLNQYKNLRPKSACLTKAFQTMIHDRTIMQRIDRRGSSDKAKNVCTIDRTIEGPKYKIINTALKREMGNMLQAQKQKLLKKYEQQKMGVGNCHKAKSRSTSQLSTRSTMAKSLSLDSLPSVKKGILKHTE